MPTPEGETKKGTAAKAGLKEAGERELMRFLDLLLILNRDARVYKATGETGRLVFAAPEADDRKAAARTWQQLYQNTRRIEEARARLTANVNTDLTMELLALFMKEEVA